MNHLSSLTSLFIIAVFFFEAFCLTAMKISCRKLGREEFSKFFKKNRFLFFYGIIYEFFFHSFESRKLLFTFTWAQYVAQFLGAIFLTLFGLSLSLSSPTFILSLLFFLFTLLFLLSDFTPRLLGARFPKVTLKATAFPSSVFLTILFPLTFILLKLFKGIETSLYYESSLEAESNAKKEMIEMIHKAEIEEEGLDAIDKRLIESVITFKGKIAKEAMVPRVDLCMLSIETTLIEAARVFDQKGYSRIPVYKESIDEIVGILMYKDVLHRFCEINDSSRFESIYLDSIEHLLKPVIYTPETKKISHLLQEFRLKKAHIAIVVDEYGGTEGIVTIEDILEEIVGDIVDEYDLEEDLYTPQANEGWIVDARMTIGEIEQELGIKIPQKGDYDTIGGYVYHIAGTIPPKDFTIHQEDFELRVIKSTDRSVTKVLITPSENEADES